MRSVLVRWLMVVTLAALLCGHVTEFFDNWDHTLTTGGDTDYSIVFLAGCAGFVLVVANCATSLLGSSPTSESWPVLQLFSAFRAVLSDPSDSGLSPPPILAIRI